MIELETNEIAQLDALLTAWARANPRSRNRFMEILDMPEASDVERFITRFERVETCELSEAEKDAVRNVVAEEELDLVAKIFEAMKSAGRCENADETRLALRKAVQNARQRLIVQDFTVAPADFAL